MRVRNIGRFAIAGVGFRRSRIAKIRVLTWTRNSFSIFEISCLVVDLPYAIAQKISFTPTLELCVTSVECERY